MQIHVIVATAQQHVIGLNGDMPWGRLSNDLKFFRRITTNHIVVMGRKTFASMQNKPLPNRCNIILTRNVDVLTFSATDGRDDETIKTTMSTPMYMSDVQLNAFLMRQSMDTQPLFIIGGGELYAAWLPKADVIYKTEIDFNGEGDTFFPLFDEQLYTKHLLGQYPADEKNAYACAMYAYTRQ